MAVTVQTHADGTVSVSGRACQSTRSKNEALKPYGKQVLDYGLVLRLLPDGDQMQKLSRHIGNSRFVRNRYLNDRIAYYQEYKKTLTVAEYKKHWLPGLKEEFPFLQGTDKFALETALEKVDDACKRFFHGQAGFPNFMSKNKPQGNKYTTKYTNRNIRFVMGNVRLPYLQLPIIGRVCFILLEKESFASPCPSGTRTRRRPSANAGPVIMKCPCGWKRSSTRSIRWRTCLPARSWGWIWGFMTSVS